jgi:chemotaxis protein MotB
VRRTRSPDLDRVAHRERWLVSYADFITLLFAFFTTLYAISVVDARKAERLVQSIHESFGGALTEGAPERSRWDQSEARPGEPVAERSERDTQRLDAVRDRAEQLARSLDDHDAVRVQSTERGIVISLSDSMFFEPAGSAIPERARAVLLAVARELAPLPNHVRIEGHTDDVPVATQAYPSNWHLSTARAVAVVIAFVDSGIPPYRLSAAGFADQRPLVPNATAQGRRMNRRVDVVVLRNASAEGA